MQVQTMDYSCIIFDTAPTGHTLRLLQFPTTLQKGLSKLMSLKGMFGGILSQLGSLFGGGGDDVQGQLLGKLEQMKVSYACGLSTQQLQECVLVCACKSGIIKLPKQDKKPNLRTQTSQPMISSMLYLHLLVDLLCCRCWALCLLECTSCCVKCITVLQLAFATLDHMPYVQCCWYVHM